MTKLAKRRTNAKGRNYTDRFVALPHYLLDCPAWLTMSLAAKALLIQVWRRFNGANNGEISFSVREAEQIGIRRSSAGRAFKEAVERGFLRVVRESTFNQKGRKARTWRLTALEAFGKPATKEFMRWGTDRSEKHATVPSEGHSVPLEGPSVPI